MSSIIKLFLFLAVAVCISAAQLNEPGQSCLCQRVRNGISSKSDIKDIQIYPATIFCNKVEIVVTSGKGYRYCLNPELKAVKRMLTKVMNSKVTTPSNPTTISSSASSSSTA
ncbi:PREDICTED: C-X-C motif chemokine 10-like [Cyprinodon variegatus]|uniref:C-X-C motif chemokine 10-like n=1 Tax=Cyprinodon variegatus TaxID=28743 RepID=A0A3Q2DDL2_CYPVA|nr:PREDICTED: C-X-C motif chemokine 10-like [Cyprinodon variegatus]